MRELELPVAVHILLLGAGDSNGRADSGLHAPGAGSVVISDTELIHVPARGIRTKTCINDRSVLFARLC